MLSCSDNQVKTLSEKPPSDIQIAQILIPGWGLRPELPGNASLHCSRRVFFLKLLWLNSVEGEASGKDDILSGIALQSTKLNAVPEMDTLYATRCVISQ